MGAIRRAAKQVDATASLLEQVLAQAATSGIRVKLDGLPPLLAKLVGSDVSVVLTIAEPVDEGPGAEGLEAGGN